MVIGIDPFFPPSYPFLVNFPYDMTRLSIIYIAAVPMSKKWEKISAT